MSIWLTHTLPLAQTPDSLSRTDTPQEPDTQAVQHADTAGTDVPHREAETADTAHAARSPRPAALQQAPAQADTTQTPAVSAQADSLQAPMPLPADAHSTAGTDSIISAMLHFQEPDGGYFADSPYWHPELPARQVGFRCQALPYRVSSDSHLACAALLCLVMLVYMLQRYGSEMRSKMHDFFLPARIRQSHQQGLSTAQGLLSMPYVCLMLSMMGCMGVSVLEEDSLGLLPNAADRLAVQGFYMASWLVYFFIKVNSYAFINWIFFDKPARHEWHDTLFLILTLEAVLVFPIVLLMVFQPAWTQIAIWCALSVITLTRLLLLYKTGNVFSVKIYGTLHLIVYFCTLEVAPLWVTLKLLTRLTDLL